MPAEELRTDRLDPSPDSPPRTLWESMMQAPIGARWPGAHLVVVWTSAPRYLCVGRSVDGVVHEGRETHRKGFFDRERCACWVKLEGDLWEKVEAPALTETEKASPFAAFQLYLPQKSSKP